jgi:hypothetical protein
MGNNYLNEDGTDGGCIFCMGEEDLFSDQNEDFGTYIVGDELIIMIYGGEDTDGEETTIKTTIKVCPKCGTSLPLY